MDKLYKCGKWEMMMNLIKEIKGLKLLTKHLIDIKKKYINL